MTSYADFFVDRFLIARLGHPTGNECFHGLRNQGIPHRARLIPTATRAFPRAFGHVQRPFKQRARDRLLVPPPPLDALLERIPSQLLRFRPLYQCCGQSQIPFLSSQQLVVVEVRHPVFWALLFWPAVVWSYSTT